MAAAYVARKIGDESSAHASIATNSLLSKFRVALSPGSIVNNTTLLRKGEKKFQTVRTDRSQLLLRQLFRSFLLSHPDAPSRGDFKQNIT